MPSFTYEHDGTTDRDWVRRLIGDTDVSTSTSAQLSDEEIDSIITEETSSGASLKYFAAARALEILYNSWVIAGKGVVDKQVGKLRIKRSLDTNADEAIRGRISELRKRGAFLLTPASPKSRVFRVVGRP